MCHAHYEKWEKINNRWNRTTKSRKNQNVWREGKLEVLRNIGSGYHQASEYKRKKKKDEKKKKKEKRKEYYRRTRKLLHQTKLFRRKFIKGINTKTVSLVRYAEPFLEWTKEKLRQMNQTAKKLMTMYKRDDIDYICQKKKKKRLPSIEDCKGFDKYTKKSKERLIAVSSNRNGILRSNRKITKTKKSVIERKTTICRAETTNWGDCKPNDLYMS